MGKSREASKHNVPKKNMAILQVGDLFWGRLVSDVLRDPRAGKVTSKGSGEDKGLVNFAEESSIAVSIVP